MGAARGEKAAPGKKAAKRKQPARAKRTKPKTDEWGLSPQERHFCQEYVVDKNASRAAREAGYSAKTAGSQASRLLKRVNVQRYNAHLLAEAAKRAEVSADEIIQRYTRVMRANPNELVQNRRHCCRYCWGQKNQYQYTPAEWKARIDKHKAAAEIAESTGKKAPPPLDPEGGLGYDKRKEPNPECPECWGEGEIDVFIADTRTLSADAAELYAGIKVTKDGIQVLTDSRERAREMLGKHLGLFKDQVEVGASDELVAAILRGRQRAGGKQD